MVEKLFQETFSAQVGEVSKKLDAYVSSEDRVSSVIGLMGKHGLYAVPVVDEGRYMGVVYAQDIVASGAPATARARTVMSSPPRLAPEDPLRAGFEHMYANTLAAVPVCTEKSVHILSFWDAVSHVLKDAKFAEGAAGDIVSESGKTLLGHDEVDKAKVALRRVDLTEALVSEGQVNRLLGETDYAKAVKRRPQKTQTLGERRGEKVKRLAADARSIADQVRVQVAASDSLRKLLEDMVAERTTYALVEDSLVSFRDVIGHVLANLEEGPDLFKQKVVVLSKTALDEGLMQYMDSGLRDFAGYFTRRFGEDHLQELKVMVKTYNEEGKKTTYEMSANLVTDSNQMHAQKSGWYAGEVFDDLLDALRKQLRW